MSSNNLVDTTADQDEKRKYKFKAVAFLLGVAGVSSTVGFARTIAMAKKQDAHYFSKGMTASADIAGVQLAMKALAYGTFYAIVGTGTLFYGIWKLSGANNLQEFRIKCGSILPKIPKNEAPTSRTEFEGLNDLMTYLSTWKNK